MFSPQVTSEKNLQSGGDSQKPSLLGGAQSTPILFFFFKSPEVITSAHTFLLRLKESSCLLLG